MLSHSEKQNAAATWKKTFGFHPLAAFADHGTAAGGEAGILLRPGNTGSNTASEYIEVTRVPSPMPDRAWLGRALAISDFISDREFRSSGLYAEVCKPLDVQAVLKAFLPTGGATAASFVFDTSRSRFTDTDRLTLQRLLPHLGQLRRNAHARKTYPALRNPPRTPARGCTG